MGDSGAFSAASQVNQYAVGSEAILFQKITWRGKASDVPIKRGGGGFRQGT